MKVLKHGKKWLIEEEHVIRCPECECVFKYRDEDVIETQTITLWKRVCGGNVVGQTPHNRLIRYLICPECNHKILLSEAIENIHGDWQIVKKYKFE